MRDLIDRLKRGVAPSTQSDRRHAPGDDAAGPPNHDRHHGDAEQQHAIERGIEVRTENEPQTLRVAHRLEAAHQNDGGKRYPDLAAKTAEHNDGENRCRLHEGEGLWADEALAGGKECAGKTAKHGPGRESGELGDGRVDAERAAGNLVLAHGLPSLPDRQAPQTQGQEIGEDGKREDHVIEKNHGVEGIVAKAKKSAECLAIGAERKTEEGRLWNIRYAVWAVGDLGPIDQHDAHDLGEGERHDGKIVTPEPEYRESDGTAPERRGGTGNRQAHPE